MSISPHTDWVLQQNRQTSASGGWILGVGSNWTFARAGQHWAAMKTHSQHLQHLQHLQPNFQLEYTALYCNRSRFNIWCFDMLWCALCLPLLLEVSFIQALMALWTPGSLRQCLCSVQAERPCCLNRRCLNFKETWDIVGQCDRMQDVFNVGTTW